MDKNLLEVSMMLGDAIDKLNNLSAYKDPYKELKEAQERGEVIQWLNDFDLWVDTKTPIRTCRKSHPPDRYRIKPKEKKKPTLVDFVKEIALEQATRDLSGTAWLEDFIKRIDDSTIEVDA